MHLMLFLAAMILGGLAPSDIQSGGPGPGVVAHKAPATSALGKQSRPVEYTLYVEGLPTNWGGPLINCLAAAQFPQWGYPTSIACIRDDQTSKPLHISH